jgi:hypothetical protein
MRKRLLILVILVLPAAVFARDWTVTVGTTTQIAADREFDPLAKEDDIVLAHLEVGMELEEVLEGLNLELDYEPGGRYDALFAGTSAWLNTELDIHRITLGASLRLEFFTWFYAVGRLAGTLDFARLEIHDANNTYLSDWANAKLGMLGTLGVEFLVPRNLWRRWFQKAPGEENDGFTLGLRLEAGWSLRQAYDYDEMRAPDSGSAGEAEVQIDRQAVKLGAVNLDGFVFRVGLIVFF